MTAFSDDQFVAVRFSVNRQSNGSEFRGAEISNAAHVPTNLTYPHNGETLEGIIFKADEMEVKWDICIYDNCFFFVRSWTGELVYKAHAEILSDKIIIGEIDYAADTDAIYAVNAVHFLMKSHAFGQIFPHYVTDLPDNEKSIALLSFNQFGNKACYACYEDITDALISEKYL